MNPVQVIALKDHEWNYIPRKIGERYEVDSEDVRFDAMLALGLAEVIPDDIHPDSGTPDPRPPRTKKRAA